MRTPLPAVYLYLGARRLRDWRNFLVELKLTELPPPLSEELDSLMVTFWAWEKEQDYQRAIRDAAKREELEEESRTASILYAPQRKRFNEEVAGPHPRHHERMRRLLAEEAIAALNKARTDGSQAP